MDSKIQIDTYPIPVSESTAEEVLSLWNEHFPPSMDAHDRLSRGLESEHNRTMIHMARAKDLLVATVELTYGLDFPTAGGLSKVVTRPEFRKTGLATQLCARAVSHYRAEGGTAIFLGTVNPVAARVYARVGWSRLAGTNVWLYTAGGELPEEYMVDFFREPPGDIEIIPGSPAARILVIPLILTPHVWQVMDANVGVLSTRYTIQNSCMGLYPKYDRLVNDKTGTWFMARGATGKIVGLSSVRLEPSSSTCQIDGFTHERYDEYWDPLIERAEEQASMYNVDTLCASCSSEDRKKIERFQRHGFKHVGEDEIIQIGDREVPSVRLQK